MQCKLDTSFIEEIVRLHLSWRTQTIPSGLGTIPGCTQVSTKKEKSECSVGLDSLFQGRSETLHPAMAWTHKFWHNYPWAEERTGIEEDPLSMYCSDEVGICTTPDFDEQILWSLKLPFFVAFDPVLAVLVDRIDTSVGLLTWKKMCLRLICQIRAYLVKVWEFLCWKAVTLYVGRSEKLSVVTFNFLTEYLSCNSAWLLFTFIFASLRQLS